MSTKLAIVTGGGQGIGRAIAAGLVAEGFFVVIADIDAGKARQAVAELGETKSAFIRCNIAEENDVAQFFATLQDRVESLQVVVNNAGIIRDKPIWKMEAEAFDAVIGVNLRGTWLMCREAARIMRKNNYGRIINIASRAWLGNFGQTNYSASKAGIVGLTRSLALELAKNKITANVVAPGLIATPMTLNLPESVQQQLIAAQPTKEMGSVEDIAALVTFLASRKAGFITGQVLHVDGGKSIGARVA